MKKKKSSSMSLLGILAVVAGVALIASTVDRKKVSEAIQAVNPFRKKTIYEMDMRELNDELTCLVKSEQYEEACLVRDEINRRKKTTA